MNRALWAAAAAGVQVGAAIVASRFAVAEVPPLTLALLRYTIGFACLAPFAGRFLGSFRVDPGVERPRVAINSGVLPGRWSARFACHPAAALLVSRLPTPVTEPSSPVARHR